MQSNNTVTKTAKPGYCYYCAQAFLNVSSHQSSCKQKHNTIETIIDKRREVRRQELEVFNYSTSSILNYDKQLMNASLVFNHVKCFTAYQATTKFHDIVASLDLVGTKAFETTNGVVWWHKSLVLAFASELSVQFFVDLVQLLTDAKEDVENKSITTLKSEIESLKQQTEWLTADNANLRSALKWYRNHNERTPQILELKPPAVPPAKTQASARRKQLAIMRKEREQKEAETALQEWNRIQDCEYKNRCRTKTLLKSKGSVDRGYTAKEEQLLEESIVHTKNMLDQWLKAYDHKYLITTAGEIMLKPKVVIQKTNVVDLTSNKVSTLYNQGRFVAGAAGSEYKHAASSDTAYVSKNEVPSKPVESNSVNNAVDDSEDIHVRYPTKDYKPEIRPLRNKRKKMQSQETEETQTTHTTNDCKPEVVIEKKVHIVPEWNENSPDEDILGDGDEMPVRSNSYKPEVVEKKVHIVPEWNENSNDDDFLCDDEMPVRSNSYKPEVVIEKKVRIVPEWNENSNDDDFLCDDEIPVNNSNSYKPVVNNYTYNTEPEIEIKPVVEIEPYNPGTPYVFVDYFQSKEFLEKKFEDVMQFEPDPDDPRTEEERAAFMELLRRDFEEKRKPKPVPVPKPSSVPAIEFDLDADYREEVEAMKKAELLK